MLEGGIKVHPDVTIAIVVMEDGTEYEIKGVVDGYLIEVNENLLKDGTYIQNYPESKGYVALVSPFGNK